MNEVNNQEDLIYKKKLVAAIRHLLHNNFYAFCVFIDPLFFTDKRPHLKKLCDALQSVSDGKTKKLIISIPPRGGKSYTTSLWCAWLIGKGATDPGTSIMRNSYGQSLAEKFSYDVRDMISSDKFKLVFPNVALKSDKSKVSDWSITSAAQSTYFCSGVGGAITGKGCKTVAILDDPIKNLEDAMSELILEKTWLWYLSTHKSRLESDCPEVHIATRWSLKDPIGMLEQNEPGEWTVVKIPALDKHGNSYCEDIKSTKEYQELKKILDPFIWEAEFMQNPIQAKGLLYPPNELNYFEGKLNKDGVTGIVGYTDTADEGKDYLCSITGVLYKDKVYIADVVYTQEPIEVTEPLVAQQIIKNKHAWHKIESNAGGKSFALRIRSLIKDKAHCSIKWAPNTTNKETRMLLNSGLVKDKFYFRSDSKPGSDYDLFLRHLTSMVKAGKNKHDDSGDAITGLCEMIFSPNIRILT